MLSIMSCLNIPFDGFQNPNISRSQDSCTPSLVVANQSNPNVLPPMVIHTSYIGNLHKDEFVFRPNSMLVSCVLKTQPLNHKNHSCRILKGAKEKTFFLLRRCG